MDKQTENLDFESEPGFTELVQKFERLSLEGKKKMIKRLDVFRLKAKEIDGEEIPIEIKKAVSEMKIFFEKRLEAKNE